MKVTDECKSRLVAVGEKLKAKGWKSASIGFGAHYLGIFDRDPSELDPMITFSATIRSNGSRNYVKEWTFDTLEAAIAALEATAEQMPRFDEEEKRKSDALAKLSPDEFRLVRDLILAG
jgi:hypothetical protein